MTAVAKSVTQAATLEDASSSVVPANPEVVAVARRNPAGVGGGRGSRLPRDGCPSFCRISSA
ncbi:MAG: hypothetical protein ABIP64_08650 [Burkholderiales bacterium]